MPFETALSPIASPQEQLSCKAQFLPLTSGCQEKKHLLGGRGDCKPTAEVWRTNGSQGRTHLYPAQAGLNLKLFHHLACLANTHSAVNRGLSFHPGVKTDNSVPSALQQPHSWDCAPYFVPLISPLFSGHPVFFLSGENREGEMKWSPNPWVLVIKLTNDLRILSL